MRSILIATNNKGKIDEIKAMLDGLGHPLLTPAEMGLALEVAEDGQTYAENATRKAAAFALASGMIALGDDFRPGSGCPGRTAWRAFAPLLSHPQCHRCRPPEIFA